MGLANISLAEGVGLVRGEETGTAEKNAANDEAGDLISDRVGVLATAS